MISGTTCNCSKFSLSSPIRNPKRLNEDMLIPEEKALIRDIEFLVQQRKLQ